MKKTNKNVKNLYNIYGVNHLFYFYCL